MKGSKAYKLSLALMVCFYLLAGALHFIMPEFYLKLIPDYFPEKTHKIIVYLSGLAEIILGFGVITPQYRKLSAMGIIALLIAVFPANIHAYVNNVDLGVPNWVLLVRLPLQAVFIYWAYTFVKEPKHAPVNH
ncbi:MAG: DoxX-like family protein [Leptospiraceae bacterium]|nr:DoxX-like family protein [Leptospiraceae bacterium]